MGRESGRKGVIYFVPGVLEIRMDDGTTGGVKQDFKGVRAGKIIPAA